MNRRFSKVAVLMGGCSSEREVSLRSGAAVVRGLQTKGYEVTPVVLGGEGLRIPSGIEAVFLALHGAYGEDGGVQADLDKQGIPYTGSGAAASRCAFDKGLTREACMAAHIPVAEGEVLRKVPSHSPWPLPVVVKPTREGSSVGCHRVFDEGDWERAAQDALSRHGEYLVEKFIPGRELTVGVVGDQVLPAVEIRAPQGDYNFKAKYTPGMTEYLCPAPVTADQAVRLSILAAETFHALKARGLGRVDFRMTPEGDLFVLELNSIPGFTETSLLPKAAAAADIDFPTLCERVLQLAECGIA